MPGARSGCVSLFMGLVLGGSKFGRENVKTSWCRVVVRVTGFSLWIAGEVGDNDDDDCGEG